MKKYKIYRRRNNLWIQFIITQKIALQKHLAFRLWLHDLVSLTEKLFSRPKCEYLMKKKIYFLWSRSILEPGILQMEVDGFSRFEELSIHAPDFEISIRIVQLLVLFFKTAIHGLCWPWWPWWSFWLFVVTRNKKLNLRISNWSS